MADSFNTRKCERCNQPIGYSNPVETSDGKLVHGFDCVDPREAAMPYVPTSKEVKSIEDDTM